MDTQPELEYVPEDEDTNSPNAGSAPWLEIGCAFLTAILFDICIYHGGGAAGWSVFFLGATLLYFVGTLRERALKNGWLIGGMLILICLRLIWLNQPGAIFCGLVLLPALAMRRNGLEPTWWDYGAYGFQSLLASSFVLRDTGIALQRRKGIKLSYIGVLGIALPVGALLVFGTIFVLANPDLATSISTLFTNIDKWLTRLLNRAGFGFDDFVLLVIIAWLALGQLVPVMKQNLQEILGFTEGETKESGEPEPFALYSPIRNTLIAVVVLFFVYLTYEFCTIPFREIPPGAYWKYAHQGAAWLTLALAIATLMLSAIFRGELLQDERVEKLKTLAWWWSAANFILALAVYNRMFIYVRFNGMTYMRVVGLYGITTVVVGFLLVVWKIRHNQGFLWLIKRQLWALSIAIYLLCVTPVDWLVYRWNVWQILSGNPKPAVQITEHDIDLGGWLALHDLVDCEDPTIREGVRAKLAEFYYEGVHIVRPRRTKNADHWSDYQLVPEQLRQRLEESKELWEPYEQEGVRNEAWNKFKKYAYQWY
ncbi:MAG: DUF4153 domain-containing protein [Planctomycetaceae bacterium]